MTDFRPPSRADTHSIVSKAAESVVVANGKSTRNLRTRQESAAAQERRRISFEMARFDLFSSAEKGIFEATIKNNPQQIRSLLTGVTSFSINDIRRSVTVRVSYSINTEKSVKNGPSSYKDYLKSLNDRHGSSSRCRSAWKR